MSFRFPKLPLTQNPADPLNYSFLGKARIDHLNGVGKLSAQIPSAETPSRANQKIQQSDRLHARLNTYVDTLLTPQAKERVQIGPVRRSFTQIPVPTLKDGRLFTLNSFNERKAYNKLKSDFKSFNLDVATEFQKKIQQLGKIDDADPHELESKAHIKFGQLKKELQSIAEKRLIESMGRRSFQPWTTLVYKECKKGPARVLLDAIQAPVTVPLALLHLKSTQPMDIGELKAKKKDLEIWRSIYDDFHFLNMGPIAFSLVGRSRKLRQIQRRIAEIENPSSYELERAKNRGNKVTNHSLYHKALTESSRIKLGMSMEDVQKVLAPNNGVVDHAGPLVNHETPLNIEAHQKGDTSLLVHDEIAALKCTEQKFEELYAAIREFQASDNTAEATESLRKIAREILYSGERGALHDFIREEMPRQLKRAGVANDPALSDEFEALKKLIPKRASIPLKSLQSVLPGIGKQMRLQDEALQMEDALVALLKLLGKAPVQSKIKKNLMHFNLDGVSALKAVLDKMEDRKAGIDDQPADIVNRDTAAAFLKSVQGKDFIKAVIASYKASNNIEVNEVKKIPLARLEKLSQSVWKTKNNPDETVTALNNLLCCAFRDAALTFDALTRDNLHLFMESSDREFWEQEAVEKVKTPLVPKADGSKYRLHKKMELRAAALGIPEEKMANHYNIQGIAHTLRNRSMWVAGSKTLGTGFAVIGHGISTFATAPAAAMNPLLAGPGVLGSIFSTIGYSFGALVGGLYGATTMEKQKTRRLAEVKKIDEDDAKRVGDLNNRTARTVKGSMLFEAQGASTPAAPDNTYTSASKKLCLCYSQDGWFKNIPKGIKREAVDKPVLQPMHTSTGRQFLTGHKTESGDFIKEFARGLWHLSSLPVKSVKWLAEDMIFGHGLKRASAPNLDAVEARRADCSQTSDTTARLTRENIAILEASAVSTAFNAGAQSSLTTPQPRPVTTNHPTGFEIAQTSALFQTIPVAARQSAPVRKQNDRAAQEVPGIALLGDFLFGPPLDAEDQAQPSVSRHSL